MKQAEIEEAARILDVLRKERPDYFAPAALPAGTLRGVDVYNPDQLSRAFAVSLSLFRSAHGRLPDLVDLPETSDCFLKMKFFDPVLTSPNPASKLDCAKFVPPSLSELVKLPKRPWMSETPVLPADDVMPPGIYWLKLEFGFSKHIRVIWPLSQQHRQQAETKVAELMSKRFGPQYGEWWYGVGRQRLFMEEDLSAVIDHGSELKIYVRRGRAMAGYFVKYLREDGRKKTIISFFDAAGHPEEGTLRLGRRNVFYDQVPFERPPNFSSILDAAAQIGSDLDLVRVDFFVGPEGTLYLGELSLCHGSATVEFSPPRLEQALRQRLFGPSA